MLKGGALPTLTSVKVELPFPSTLAVALTYAPVVVTGGVAVEVVVLSARVLMEVARSA